MQMSETFLKKQIRPCKRETLLLTTLTERLPIIIHQLQSKWIAEKL